MARRLPKDMPGAARHVAVGGEATSIGVPQEPEPQIRLLWGTQYVNPYFARPMPEDGKVLTFAQDVRL